MFFSPTGRRLLLAGLANRNGNIRISVSCGRSSVYILKLNTYGYKFQFGFQNRSIIEKNVEAIPGGALGLSIVS